MHFGGNSTPTRFINTVRLYKYNCDNHTEAARLTKIKHSTDVHPVIQLMETISPSACVDLMQALYEKTYLKSHNF